MLKLKGKLFNFVLAVSSVILFFSLAETTLRFIKFSVNQKGGYLEFICWRWAADKYNIPRNIQDSYLFWQVNNNGNFRERYHPLIKLDGSYRIICLGDSTTQGYMRPPVIVSPEKTYPYILEEFLNKDNQKIHFEVINAGVGGYSSFQGLRYLKRDLLKYHPDLLIVWFGMRDVDTAILYSDKEQKPQSEIALKVQNILNYSKFYQFYRQYLFYLTYRFRQKIQCKKRRVSVNDYHQNLRKLVELAKERGIGIVFIIPFIKEGHHILSFKEIGYNDYIKIFDEFSQEKIIVIDVSSVFKQKDSIDKYFFDECHPTPEGNRIIADVIHDTLIKKELIQTIHDKS